MISSFLFVLEFYGLVLLLGLLRFPFMYYFDNEWKFILDLKKKISFISNDMDIQPLIHNTIGKSIFNSFPTLITRFNVYTTSIT